MENKNVLNFRELHNHGIKSEFKNFDLLCEFLLEDFSDIGNSYNFSVVGFDYGDDGFVRQFQPMLDYDIFEVLRECYYNEKKYGERFCILHHDLSGFHYFVY